MDAWLIQAGYQPGRPCAIPLTEPEAGIKGEYLDGRLNFSLAAFLMRQNNRPVDDLTSTNRCKPGNQGWCKRAGGEVESKGVELEVAGSPLPGCNLVAGYDFANRQVPKARRSIAGRYAL